MDKQPLYCVGISTSPRPGGNTSILVEKALQGAAKAGASTELINLNEYRFSPCVACNGCFKEGKCIVQDDMQLLYEKLLAADRIILATPIFSMGMCAQAKAMVDRAQRFWATKYVLKKEVIPEKSGRPPRRGMFISTAGSNRKNVFDGALQVAKYFFLMLETELTASCCYKEIDGKREILKHPAALDEVYQAGFNLGVGPK